MLQESINRELAHLFIREEAEETRKVIKEESEKTREEIKLLRIDLRGL